MADTPPPPADDNELPPVPDSAGMKDNPAGLRGSLERTGRYLKQAGLPFEEDEFEDAPVVDAAEGAAEVTDADPA